MAKPEADHATWVSAGYLFALLGGFVGLLIGLTLATHRKTLPNGERAYAYTAKDRKHGWIIFFMGLITFTISLYLNLSNFF